VGNNKKHELVPLIDRFLADKNNDGAIIDINESGVGYEELSLFRTAEHTRAFIKVQDGCNQFCSYCIIPYVRGRVRSRKSEDVTEEVKRLAASGYKEVVLTGIHLSSYGTDTGGSLIHLIEEVSRIDGIERIRLGSLEPRIVTDGFAARLAACKKVCPHFHLSLQSGCDTVLSRMNRKYDTGVYEKCCDTLRKYFANPAITTDVIVGFPGETDGEFETTVDFLKKIGFYEMHIFKYSKREGTRAAAMDDQVDEQVKNMRSARLLSLTGEMSERYREAQTGRTVTALMEEPYIFNDRRYYTGFTPEYVKVAYETDDDIPNTFVTGKIAGALSDGIMLLM
jgi:threonylcarbamoyladenosine tRNA methylthiotransferase MtaB